MLYHITAISVRQGIRGMARQELSKGTSQQQVRATRTFRIQAKCEIFMHLISLNYSKVIYAQDLENKLCKHGPSRDFLYVCIVQT